MPYLKIPERPEKDPSKPSRLHVSPDLQKLGKFVSGLLFGETPQDHIEGVMPGSGSMLGMQRALRGVKVWHGTARRYRHHDPNLAGTANPYFSPSDEASGRIGKGIYFTDDSRSARMWAENLQRSYSDMIVDSRVGRRLPPGQDVIVRRHNIPPQAQILDLDKRMSKNELMQTLSTIEDFDPGWGARIRLRMDPVTGKVAKHKHMGSRRHGAVSFRDLLETGSVNTTDLHHIAPRLGYDGAVTTLPFGGGKEWVIFNYDVINDPRKHAVAKGYKRAMETTQ